MALDRKGLLFVLVRRESPVSAANRHSGHVPVRPPFVPRSSQTFGREGRTRFKELIYAQVGGKSPNPAAVTVGDSCSGVRGHVGPPHHPATDS